MQAFYTCIYDITYYIAYVNKSTYPYIIYPNFGIKYIHQREITTPTSASLQESMRECRRRNERIWRYMRTQAVWNLNLNQTP